MQSKKYTDRFKKSNKQWDLIIGVVFILSVIHVLMILLQYGISIYYLRDRIVSSHFLYILSSSVVPFAFWMISTTTEYWNFHKRKLFFFTIATCNAILVCLQPVYSFLWGIIVPHVIQMTTNEIFSEKMLLSMSRIALLIPMLLVIAILFGNILPLIYTDTTKSKLETFKLKHHIDVRKNKENLYDMNIVKDLKTGEYITIRENDRFTPTVVNGVSGTGKTSSTMIVSIYKDIKKKDTEYCYCRTDHKRR